MASLLPSESNSGVISISNFEASALNYSDCGLGAKAEAILCKLSWAVMSPCNCLAGSSGDSWAS